jgi:outer membrane protein assembly factor BamB
MTSRGLLTTVLLCALALGLLGASPSSQVADWHQWRGPNRDGVSPETGLLQSWPSEGPPQLWRTTSAGEGYSSFSASNGRLYTLGARGTTEYLSAFDIATGRKLWEQPNGQRFRNDRGDGPRSTPTVDGARVFVFGGSGDLTAFDAATGSRIWSVNVVRTHGGVVPYWGYSESPLVLSDRVLVNVGGRGASIVAFNKADGAELWRSESDDAGYSSPVLLRTGSLPQVVYFTGRRALAVDARDGRLLWSYPRVANRTANIATPIVRGTQVFLSSDYGTGAALLQVRAAGNVANAEEVYFTRDMRNHHASSVLVGDHLYGFSGSILTAMRFASGEVAWRDRSVGKGSIIAADNRLYLYSESGVVGLAAITPDGYREHGRFRIQQGNLPTWSHPIISGGRLILRDQDTVWAFDVRRPGRE